MAQHNRNTPEWFNREKLDLIEHLKAVDSFSAAARSFQKLSDLGEAADAEVRAALHTAGVINYARPFSAKQKFAKSVIKDHENYDVRIHRQLVDLRNKLIAHSDRDYVDGRLFVKRLTLSNGSEDQFEELLIGASLVTQTVHLLEDLALAARYLTHVKAAEEAAVTALGKRLEEFVKAGRQFPGELKAAATTEPRPRIDAGRVDLNLSQPSPTPMPRIVLNPCAVLGKPPLTMGQDGYAYRGLALEVDLSGGATLRADDGSEVSINWGPGPKSSEDG